MSHEITIDVNAETGETKSRATYQAGKDVWHAAFTHPDIRNLAEMSGAAFCEHLRSLKILATDISKETCVTETGVKLRSEGAGADFANVATYADGSREHVGTVGRVYETTDQSVMSAVIQAITDECGLAPSGAFSTYNGSGVCYVWRLGIVDGKERFFMLLDDFAGRRHLTGGYVITDPICANTIKIALYQSGDSCVALRHSGDLNAKLAALPLLVEEAKEDSLSLCKAYSRFADVELTEEQIDSFIARLPGCQATKDGKVPTQAKNKRTQIRTAAKSELNGRGLSAGSLQRYVNAANYSVDRNASDNGSIRKKATPAESMLFGQRGDDVNEIVELATIYVAMADGTTEEMTVPQAVATGQVDHKQMGESILDSMLG